MWRTKAKNLVESCKGQSDKQFKFGFIARRLYNKKKTEPLDFQL